MFIISICTSLILPSLVLLTSFSYLFFNLSVQEFIEEILSPPFGGMIAFVKEAEVLMEKGQLDRLKSEEGEMSLVVSARAGGR